MSPLSLPAVIVAVNSSYTAVASHVKLFVSNEHAVVRSESVTLRIYLVLGQPLGGKSGDSELEGALGMGD